MLLVAGVSSRGMKKEQPVLLTHGDSVDKVGRDLKAIAHSGKIIAGTDAFSYISIR